MVNQLYNLYPLSHTVPTYYTNSSKSFQGMGESFTPLASIRLIQQNGCRFQTHEHRPVSASRLYAWLMDQPGKLQFGGMMVERTLVRTSIDRVTEKTGPARKVPTREVDGPAWRQTLLLTYMEAEQVHLYVDYRTLNYSDLGLQPARDHL